jgi:hypothetical protein
MRDHRCVETDGERRERLVDDAMFDELLREVTLSDIAEAYWRYQSAWDEHDGHPEGSPDYWALCLWMSFDWWEGGDEAHVRQGVLELVERVESDEDFSFLGAAVMEMLFADGTDRVLDVPGHQVGDMRLIGGRPPRALWRRRVL